MGIFGTSASNFADYSLILEALILGSFIVGIRYARRHLSNHHYKIMTGGFFLNFLFVGAYMIRSLLGEGSASFLGPDDVRDFVYLPTVIVHGISSILAFILAGSTLYYGYTHTVQKKIRTFTSPDYRLKHRLLGILSVSTWTLAFVTGIFVYILLYALY